MIWGWSFQYSGIKVTLFTKLDPEGVGHHTIQVAKCRFSATISTV